MSSGVLVEFEAIVAEARQNRRCAECGADLHYRTSPRSAFCSDRCRYRFRDRRRYIENPERERKKSRRYYAEHRDKVLAWPESAARAARRLLGVWGRAPGATAGCVLKAVQGRPVSASAS